MFNHNLQNNLSKTQLINRLCNTPYTYNEKKNIFLHEDGIKCRTFHCLKIKKKLCPDDFSNKHKGYICFCDTQPKIKRQKVVDLEVNNNLNLNQNNNGEIFHENNPSQLNNFIVDNQGDIVMNNVSQAGNESQHLNQNIFLNQMELGDRFSNNGNNNMNSNNGGSIVNEENNFSPQIIEPNNDDNSIVDEEVLFVTRSEFNSEMNKVHGRIDNVENLINGINGRLDNVENSINGINGRLDNMDKFMNNINSKMMNMESFMNNFNQRMINLEKYIIKNNNN